MLILGVDTSGRHGSIALAVGENAGAQRGASFHVLEVAPLAGGTYSARLIPEIAAVLARHSFDRKDLDVFAVVSGPGSFTGLRVGLSTVKGLAEILKKPVAAVSMLEAVAAQSRYDGRVMAAIDAGRKQVFAGEYEMRGGSPLRIRELLVTETQFPALMDSNTAAELITPDDAVARLAAMHLHVRRVEWPNAGQIAWLGYRKVQTGQTLTPEALEANYIRRSDAEIFGSS